MKRFHIHDFASLCDFVSHGLPMPLSNMTTNVHLDPTFNLWSAYRSYPHLFSDDAFYSYVLLGGFFEKESIRAMQEDVDRGVWRMVRPMPFRLLARWAEEMQLAQTVQYYDVLMEKTWEHALSEPFMGGAFEAVPIVCGNDRRVWMHPLNVLRMLRDFTYSGPSDKTFSLTHCDQLVPAHWGSGTIRDYLLSTLKNVHAKVDIPRADVLIREAFQSILTEVGWDIPYAELRVMCDTAQSLYLSSDQLAAQIYHRLHGTVKANVDIDDSTIDALLD